MTFVQDNKSSGTMTEDSRTLPATLTQDIKTIGNNLWTSLMLPWQMDFPWLWDDNGALITLDPRHNG
jgi:hypothetical protein